MTEIDIEQIVAGCKAGKAESFSLLLDVYGQRCYAYFYRLCGDRELSSELLSELYLKLVKSIRHQKGDNFEGWLFRIAGNIFYDYLRSKQLRQKLIDAKTDELRNSPKEKERETDFDELQNFIDRLDNDSKEIVLTRIYSSMNFREIAKMRGEPIGTTLSKYHRAIKRLRELMGQTL